MELPGSIIFVLILLVLTIFSPLKINTYLLFFFAPFYLYIYLGTFAFYNCVTISLLIKRFFFERPAIPFEVILMTAGVAMWEFFCLMIYSQPITLYPVKWILAFVLSGWMLYVPVKGYRHDKAILWMASSTMLLCIGVIVVWWNTAINPVNRVGMGGLGSLDQNTFSMYCIFTACSVFACVLDGKKRKYSAGYLVMAGIIFIAGNFMVSKTFLLVSGLAFAYCVIYLLNKPYRFILFFLGCGIAVLICFQIPKLVEIFQVYVGRFSTENLSQLTTGRYEIYKNYGEYLLTHPMTLLLGQGIFSYFSCAGFTLSPHNTTLEIILSWGMLGLMILTVYYIFGYWKARKPMGKKHQDKIHKLPLLILVIFLQSLSVYYQDVTLFYIVFGINQVIYGFQVEEVD